MKKQLAILMTLFLIPIMLAGCQFFRRNATEDSPGTSQETWEKYYASPTPDVYGLLIAANDLEHTPYKVSGVVYYIFKSNDNVGLVYVNTPEDLKWVFVTDSLEDFAAATGDSITGYGLYMKSQTEPIPLLLLTRCIIGELQYIDSTLAAGIEQ